MRLALAWRPWQRHEFQLVLAPLAYEEKGSFDQDVRFAGSTYQADKEVTVDYKFNSYRLRYLYTLVEAEHWGFEIGGTLFVRDANIKLSQNGTSSNDSNLGFVPLLALKTTYKVNADWRLVLDTELAAAPQGRAIDLALALRRQFNNGWDIGADNDSVRKNPHRHSHLPGRDEVAGGMPRPVRQGVLINGYYLCGLGCGACLYSLGFLMSALPGNGLSCRRACFARE